MWLLVVTKTKHFSYGVSVPICHESMRNAQCLFCPQSIAAEDIFSLLKSLSEGRNCKIKLHRCENEADGPALTALNLNLQHFCPLKMLTIPNSLKKQFYCWFPSCRRKQEFKHANEADSPVNNAEFNFFNIYAL